MTKKEQRMVRIARAMLEARKNVLVRVIPASASLGDPDLADLRVILRQNGEIHG